MLIRIGQQTHTVPEECVRVYIDNPDGNGDREIIITHEGIVIDTHGVDGKVIDTWGRMHDEILPWPQEMDMDGTCERCGKPCGYDGTVCVCDSCLHAKG